MTSEQAATVQAIAAAVQTFLAFVIGLATLYFGRTANRILKLQTNAGIDPTVTLDLHPYIAHDQDEPLNYISIENHSPLELNDFTLSAEIYGTKADCPTERFPAIHQFGKLPDVPPNERQLWCIDEAINRAVEVMKIGPKDASPFKGVFTAFVRLTLHFRRKSDGKDFVKKLTVGVYKTPELPRPMAVYPDYRASFRN